MADSVITYSLKGRLVLSSSGWLLLEVPNAIGNGLFQALNEPGIEQPVSESTGRYNAHISVVRPEELETVGDAALKSRGQMFGFTTGTVREITNPGGWADVSKVWVMEIRSPELMTFRRSLGLGEPKYPFHMTFAIRKRNALKSASVIHFEKASTATVIKPSEIEGKGLFAGKDFANGDTIVERFMTRSESSTGRIEYEQSTDCRFTNHSSNPNSKVELTGDTVKLVATTAIENGDELTVDYHVATKELGDDFEYTYNGKPYDGSSSTRQSKQPAVTKFIITYMSCSMAANEADEQANDDTGDHTSNIKTAVNKNQMFSDRPTAIDLILTGHKQCPSY